MSIQVHARAVPPAGRRARRITVALTLATTAVLGSVVLPASLHGFGIVLVLFLAGLDVLLVNSTAGLAFRRGGALDERERALRDMAYRRGFRLLGLAALLEFVLLLVSEIVVSATQGGTGLALTAVTTGITGRALVALLEMLLMTPTMVIAWMDVDRRADEPRPASPRGWLPWLVLPTVVSAWVVLIVTGPAQAAAPSSATSWSTGMQGASCAHFAGGRIVGAQFGATVGMRVEVCWNGRDAFVAGDPAIPLPQSAIDDMVAAIPPADRGTLPDPSRYNAGIPGMTACGTDNVDDFETVSDTRCSAVIDGAGTLHYSVHATVSGPLGVGRHEVALNLVVDRHGAVIERP